LNRKARRHAVGGSSVALGEVVVRFQVDPMTETGTPTLVAALLAAAADRRSGTFVIDAGTTPTRLAFVRGELLLCGDPARSRDAALRCLNLRSVRWTFEESVDSVALASGVPTRLEPLLQAAAAKLPSGPPSVPKPVVSLPTPSRAIAASALKRLHDDVKKRTAFSTPPAFTPHGPPRAAEGDARPPAKKTIVVVDDDGATRAMIARALSPAYAIVEAETGLGALELLGRIPPPSVIVLDVMLPEVDGVTIARKLKGHPTLKDVPIVFVTAKSAPADVLEGIGAGAKHYLTKPFSVAALVQAVEKLTK
jgi:CheY-like chemotaxis protein